MFTLRNITRNGGTISLRKSAFIPISSLRSFTNSSVISNIKRVHNYEADAEIIVDPITGVKTMKKPMTINTELPDDPRPKQRIQSILTFLVFAVGMTAACVGIFNYEKVSSPIMNATMYFLRRSDHARELLGSKITYDGLYPWISGEVNTMKGLVDCSTRICGDKGSALMILKAEKNSEERFRIIQWLLIGANGEVVDLTNDASVDLFF
jgi:cytochrome c oxidase assembly factor 1